MWNVGTVAGNEAMRERLRAGARWLNISGFGMTINLRDMQRVVVQKDAS